MLTLAVFLNDCGGYTGFAGAATLQCPDICSSVHNLPPCLLLARQAVHTTWQVPIDAAVHARRSWYLHALTSHHASFVRTQRRMRQSHDHQRVCSGPRRSNIGSISKGADGRRICGNGVSCYLGLCHIMRFEDVRSVRSACSVAVSSFGRKLCSPTPRDHLQCLAGRVMCIPGCHSLVRS